MRKILLKLFVVMLYFIVPYSINFILSLFNINETVSLFIEFISNFILLYFVINLLKDILEKEYKIFKNNKIKLLAKGFLFFFVGLALYFISSYIIYLYKPNSIDNNYNTLISNFSKVPLLLFFSTVFYYPVIEELIFKTIFKDIIKNKYIFILTTGLLYALFQTILTANSSINLLFLIPSALFSMSFSYSYFNTKTVCVPIIYRMLYNLIPNIINIILYFSIG